MIPEDGSVRNNLTSMTGIMPFIPVILPVILGTQVVLARRLAISPFRLENRVRVARAELALSQEKLAALAGVTRQTISSIETGQYVPSALLAFVLARHLGKRVDDLFTLSGEKP
jgi:putative transcriptional regulator